MGTFCTITLDKNRSASIDEGFKQLKKIESILSSYQPHSALSQLNKHRFLVDSPLLKDILLQSKHYYHTTQGYFDISIGAITRKSYRFGEEERIPSQEALNRSILDIHSLKIQDHSITLENNISLDLGGIGKGYAIDILSTYYVQQHIKKGKIALSGDIRCLNSCQIYIQNPFNENETIAHIEAKVNQLSVSTSGTYRRYIKTATHHHLINPKKKTQARDFISVTIVSQANNTRCDVIATAVSVMPKAIALDFLKSQKDIGYLLITPQKEMLLGNLEKFVTYKQGKTQEK